MRFIANFTPTGIHLKKCQNQPNSTLSATTKVNPENTRLRVLISQFLISKFAVENVHLLKMKLLIISGYFIFPLFLCFLVIYTDCLLLKHRRQFCYQQKLLSC